MEKEETTCTGRTCHYKFSERLLSSNYQLKIKKLQFLLQMKQ